MRRLLGTVATAAAAVGLGVLLTPHGGLLPGSKPRQARGPDALALLQPEVTAADRIVNGAKLEVIRGVRYDAAYVTLSYPGGDVPADRGACTDVVVRALRRAGYDLQRLIHEDMRAHFERHPRDWAAARPDRNIDHRRVPNQRRYFERHGVTLPVDSNWQPGDLVYWMLPSGQDHCGVVSDVRGRSGRLLVVHNLGGARLDDRLAEWRVTAHHRFPRR